MNTGSSPFAPSGRTMVSGIDWPEAWMVFSETVTPDRSTLTEAWAPTSTARASCGLRVSSGWPPPAAKAWRKAWVLCSTPGLPAAKALPMAAARTAPASSWLTCFMILFLVAWGGACRQAPGAGSDADVQTYFDVAAGGVGVGADLVGRVDQRLGGVLVQARQADVQFHFQTEAAGDLADADLTGDRGVGREGLLLLAGDELQSADEAGRVTGGEQLLGVAGFAAGAAQLARGGQLDVEESIGGKCAAVAASGSGDGGGVEGFDGLHGDVSVLFAV